MRAHHALAFVLLGAAFAIGAAGCGDDGGTTGCTGHLCDAPAGQPAITDNEGGNFIFEYIYVDSELQSALGLPTSTLLRTLGYFANAMTPDANTLPTPGACENLDATKGWPMYEGSPKTELDAGTMTMTGVNTAGTSVTIPLTKKMATNDNIGRPHDIFYENITPDAPANIKPNTHYDVNITGGAVLQAHTFTGKEGVFLPNDYQIGAPLLEDNGPIAGDYAVKWTPTDSEAGEEVNQLVWLIDGTGKPAILCVGDRSTGTFTIPAATISDFKTAAAARGAPTTKVILSRQAIAHHIARLPNGDETANKRRVDFIGILCWIQLMDI